MYFIPPLVIALLEPEEVLAVVLALVVIDGD